MEKGYQRGQGVVLLDHWDEPAEKLWRSFRKSGFEGPVIVIQDEGFLPTDVLSLFGWFCLTDREKAFAVSGGTNRIQPRARFFNEIDRPDFWEITAGSAGGDVFDMNHLRGHIFYNRPGNTRLVRKVDWFDESGAVRISDHYSQTGCLYARSTYDSKGRMILKSWFDASGRERLMENAITGDLILNSEKKMQIIRNRTQLTIKLFRELGLDGERIFYNSLSTPFFVSESLPSFGERHLLFWQEPARSDVPGNMQGILNGTSRTDRVLVQDRESLEKLIEKGANQQKLQLFGFVYPYSRENTYGRDMLICTNSDQMESLEALVRDLPEMHFHIAAVTEMSSRLLSMERFENVSLYPTAQADTFRRLYTICDYYLDINYGSEILSAVKEAFLHRQLILAFSKTQHGRTYTAKEHFFRKAEDMERVIRLTASDPALMDRHLALQKRAALDETEDSYRKLMDSRHI